MKVKLNFSMSMDGVVNVDVPDNSTWDEQLDLLTQKILDQDFGDQEIEIDIPYMEWDEV